MASKKQMNVVGILLIFVVLVLVFLPYLRNLFAPAFPEGFRTLDCKGITCKEGEFCQDNTCHSVTATPTD
jgi:hypothetical protein